MPQATLDKQLEAMGVLAEPVRRSLYRFVAAQSGPVSRQIAATAVGVPRTVAAFHLDKLAEAGLLQVSLGKSGQKRGPGSGRPARLYSRPPREIGVSLPHRSYALLADALAEVIEEAGIEDLLDRVAAELGARLAAELGDHPGSEASAWALDAAGAALAAWGYEPYAAEPELLRLRNCPFRRVQERHPPLICGMNLHLLEAAIDRLAPGVLEAQLDPRPGQCCVTVSSIDKNS